MRTRHLVWLLPIAAAALAIWVQSPRFAVEKPSLVDDWYAITYSPAAVEGLVHGRYDAAAVDFGGRFRPAYLVWDYTQWYVGGSGRSMTAANVWGLVRLLFFLGVVGAAVAVLTHGLVSRGWVVALSSAAALAVALTPATAVDLARFYSAEPLSVIGLIAGLTLVAWGLRRWLRTTDEPRRRAAAVVAICLGYAAYLFGVYAKEASFAVIVLFPFLYLWLAHDPQISGRGLWRRRSLLVVGILLVLPLVHMGAQLVQAMSARNAYTDQAGGVVGLLLTGGTAVLATALGMIGKLGTPFWLLAFLAGFVWISRVRSGDSRAFLATGILAAGTTFTFLTNVAVLGPSRYFIPWEAAVAITAAPLLVLVRERLRIVVVAVSLAALALGNAHGEVQAWSAQQNDEGAAVDLAASVMRADCPLFLSNFPHEPRLGLPRLLQFGTVASYPRCGADSTVAYVVNWNQKGETLHTPQSCSSDWRPIDRRRGVSLYRCANFGQRHQVPSQDVDSNDPALSLVQLVKPNRLVPASELLTIGAK